MTWLEAITKSLNYIESHLTDELSVTEIANEVYMSPVYFQNGFSIMCDITIGEYIRNRRLSLAGRDLRINGDKVIDVAMKYGYDSPDSFTKAFTRFHGITPVQAKNGKGELKNFLPLKVQISMKGGFKMECKIIKKSAFTVIGASRIFKEGEGFTEVPKMWDEHYAKGEGKYICGMYGICVDDWSMMKSDFSQTVESRPESEACLDQTYTPDDPDLNEFIKKQQNKETLSAFKYLIADDYVPSKEYPDRFVTQEIPANTWAVFPCKGPMPSAMHDVYQKIFKEWLPGNPDYELSGTYNIEYYSDASKYPKGNQDENYYSEIWYPVKAK